MINPGRIRAGAVAFAFSLTLASQVLAQSEPAKSRDTTTDLQDVVVIGTREQARLATGSAYVIRSEELRQFEFTNVHSILRSVPGVYLREEDGLGTFPRIGIRASSSGRSDRISILEDGIPAAMAPYANTSAYYFPAVGRMSSVEVLKGPEVLRYGPQTTSGAINLLSTPIPESPTGFVNVELGAWDTRKVHTWAGGTLGQFGFLVEAYPHRTDGFQRIDRSTRTAGNDIADYLLKLRWKRDASAARPQAPPRHGVRRRLLSWPDRRRLPSESGSPLWLERARADEPRQEVGESPVSDRLCTRDYAGHDWLLHRYPPRLYSAQSDQRRRYRRVRGGLAR